jgi:hypothetical protein
MPNGTIDDPAAHNPTVSVVSTQATGSMVRVTGTAVDPDATTASAPIEIYQGDTEVASGSSQVTDHRFDVSFQAPDGSHAYTVRALNVGEGTQDTSVTTAAITVNGEPSERISSAADSTATATQGHGHDVAIMLSATILALPLPPLFFLLRWLRRRMTRRVTADLDS